MSKEKHSYYKVRIGGVLVDPYRMILLLKITHPAHQHAFKKLWRIGRSRDAKKKDLRETIETLERWEDMNAEDVAALKARLKPRRKTRVP